MDDNLKEAPVAEAPAEEMSEEEQRLEQFLKAIAQLESSGGKNFNHETMEHGIHEGHTAAGRYGLMPNTVNEVLNRMSMKGTLTPELAELRKLEPDQIKETLETNPDLEHQIARSLGKRVLERQGDETKAAFSWNQGHNLTPDRIEEMGYQDHDYVKKFNKIRGMMGSEPTEVADSPEQIQTIDAQKRTIAGGLDER